MKTLGRTLASGRGPWYNERVSCKRAYGAEHRGVTSEAMSRLTEWIARRRYLRGSARAHVLGRHSARPLSFERYEERIALSTNAPFEIVSGDAVAITTQEGGWIKLEYANASSVASTAATRSLLSFDYSNFGDFDYTNNSGTILLGAAWPTTGSTMSDLVPAGAEVLLSDTRVVPIPPPAAGQGGNEGGQISMAPFTGPATLGLPSASDSLYARQSRPALDPEGFDAAADRAPATPAETLRGRAVVYEVAHAEQRLHGDRNGLADVGASLAEPEHDARGSASVAVSGASRDDEISAADGRESGSMAEASANSGSSNARPSSDRAVRTRLAETAALPTLDHEVRTTSDDALANAATVETAAHDAVFDEWDSDGKSALGARELAAATADNHQRRVLGAVLVVLGAIPVTKALRRQAQQESVEDRPPQRRTSRPRQA